MKKLNSNYLNKPKGQPFYKGIAIIALCLSSELLLLNNTVASNPEEEVDNIKNGISSTHCTLENPDNIERQDKKRKRDFIESVATEGGAEKELRKILKTTEIPYQGVVKNKNLLQKVVCFFGDQQVHYKGTVQAQALDEKMLQEMVANICMLSTNNQKLKKKMKILKNEKEKLESKQNIIRETLESIYGDAIHDHHLEQYND